MIKSQVRLRLKALAEADKQDTVVLNVPLFIRMLEHAREDLSDDNALHIFVEGVLDASKSHGVLTMEQWPELTKANK